MSSRSSRLSLEVVLGRYAMSHFSASLVYNMAKVAYIDTEGTFRPDRIRSIADRFGVDGSMALENILYGGCITVRKVSFAHTPN